MFAERLKQARSAAGIVDAGSGRTGRSQRQDD